MTDLVERLRLPVLTEDQLCHEPDPLHVEAADEIARLRAEVASLKRRDETNADDAARYRFLFTCEDFLRDPLWPVVDWMRDGRDVPKEDVDAALDEAMGEK